MNQYQLLDSGNFQKLEQVGPYVFVRPAAQAVWRPRMERSAWLNADAEFVRSSGGEGAWKVRNKRMPESWSIDVPSFGSLAIKLTDFGHLGIFPEQHTNWARLTELVQTTTARRGAPLHVLNLFAYTGGSSLAAARGGAQVVHLDASKTSVSWAKENRDLCGMSDAPIRWIVDDAQKFVAREQRRGAKYHGIILDPPSYGRGAKGEIWKIEDHMTPLLDALKELLAPDYLFVLLSSHSTGYTPLALTNLLQDFSGASNFRIESEEMVVPEVNSSRRLPSGACAWLFNEKI